MVREVTGREPNRMDRVDEIVKVLELLEEKQLLTAHKYMQTAQEQSN